MYIVRVYTVDGNKNIDERSFEFGTWTEIGFWLDNYSYNDPRYYVKITFTQSAPIDLYPF